MKKYRKILFLLLVISYASIFVFHINGELSLNFSDSSNEQHHQFVKDYKGYDFFDSNNIIKAKNSKVQENKEIEKKGNIIISTNYNDSNKNYYLSKLGAMTFKDTNYHYIQDNKNKHLRNEKKGLTILMIISILTITIIYYLYYKNKQKRRMIEDDSFDNYY